MFRRLAAPLAAAATAATGTAMRCYSPPEDLKKLFASKFENEKFPCDIVPSDSTLFAKFLFKACEPKNAFDSVLKDFETIKAASAKLPIFWERNAQVELIPEFKALGPATLFTMAWMQDNGMLGDLNLVQEAFETYVNAQRKKAVAKIFVGAPTADTTEAKKIAQELLKANAALNGFSLDYKVVVDRAIVSGFSVEVAGAFVNKAMGADTSVKTDEDIDYTNIPAPKLLKSTWEDSIETEILSSYIEQLALYDAEEAKNGV